MFLLKVLKETRNANGGLVEFEGCYTIYDIEGFGLELAVTIGPIAFSYGIGMNSLGDLTSSNSSSVFREKGAEFHAVITHTDLVYIF